MSELYLEKKVVIERSDVLDSESRSSEDDARDAFVSKPTAFATCWYLSNRYTLGVIGLEHKRFSSSVCTT